MRSRPNCTELFVKIFRVLHCGKQGKNIIFFMVIIFSLPRKIDDPKGSRPAVKPSGKGLVRSGFL